MKTKRHKWISNGRGWFVCQDCGCRYRKWFLQRRYEQPYGEITDQAGPRLSAEQVNEKLEQLKLRLQVFEALDAAQANGFPPHDQTALQNADDLNRCHWQLENHEPEKLVPFV